MAIVFVLIQVFFADLTSFMSISFLIIQRNVKMCLRVQDLWDCEGNSISFVIY